MGEQVREASCCLDRNTGNGDVRPPAPLGLLGQRWPLRAVSVLVSGLWFRRTRLCASGSAGDLLAPAPVPLVLLCWLATFWLCFPMALTPLGSAGRRLLGPGSHSTTARVCPKSLILFHPPRLLPFLLLLGFWEFDPDL